LKGNICGLDIIEFYKTNPLKFELFFIKIRAISVGNLNILSVLQKQEKRALQNKALDFDTIFKNQNGDPTFYRCFSFSGTKSVVRKRFGK
jgi:hypothetical protein